MSFASIIKRYESKLDVRISCQKTNFVFLDNGTLVYDFERFNSIEDAIIDAVKNHGENLDEMIQLCYVQTNPSLREWFESQIS